MKKENEGLNDYQDFLNQEAPAVPIVIKDQVYTQIQKLIHPKAIMVFFKILALHVGVGFLSLSVCHQFGINPFNTEKSLADLMMRYGGHNFCMVGCGILFVSLSILASGLFLTVEEVNALKRTEFLQTISLGIISLGLFAVVGTELALSLAGLWLLGSLIGGFVATETIWRLKHG